MFLRGLGSILVGLAILIGGGALAIAWIVFCFGSVVIGVVLLLIAPGILIMPLALSTAAGWGYMKSGWALLSGDESAGG